VILKHPDVHEVGVLGVPQLESTSIARAFVVLKPGRQCTEEDICQFVAERLPSHKHLHGGVQFIDNLPQSRGYKLDKIALKNMAMKK
jgi:acyl-coenzyme A synthetase/AMP-(fatty) acid ligase